MPSAVSGSSYSGDSDRVEEPEAAQDVRTAMAAAFSVRFPFTYPTPIMEEKHLPWQVRRSFGAEFPPGTRHDDSEGLKKAPARDRPLSPARLNPWP